MAGANFLDDYEDVNARIKRFRTAYDQGRLVVHILDRGRDELGDWVLMEAQVFCHQTDLAPSGVDVAFGHVAFYKAHMKRWFMEDTATSAIGRAISLVLPSEQRPTRQNMEQVQQDDPWATPTPAESFKNEAVKMAREALAGAGISEVIEHRCHHGLRNHKTGTNAKGGKWEGYFCPSQDPDDKCATIGKDGKEWKSR